MLSLSLCALLRSYDDQLLVDYRVKCKEGDLAFLIMTYMDIEGRETCRDSMGNPK